MNAAFQEQNWIIEFCVHYVVVAVAKQLDFWKQRSGCICGASYNTTSNRMSSSITLRLLFTWAVATWVQSRMNRLMFLNHISLQSASKHNWKKWAPWNEQEEQFRANEAWDAEQRRLLGKPHGGCSKYVIVKRWFPFVWYCIEVSCTAFFE